MLLSPLYVSPSTNGCVPWAAHLVTLSSVDGEIRERFDNPMESSMEDNSCEVLAA